MTAPGPKAQPAWRLRVAAIEYAAALEAGEDTTAPWDRLRKAAKFYRDAELPKGPLGTAYRMGA